MSAAKQFEDDVLTDIACAARKKDPHARSSLQSSRYSFHGRQSKQEMVDYANGRFFPRSGEERPVFDVLAVQVEVAAGAYFAQLPINR